MKYQDVAIFSDLDGTLFDCHGIISQKNLESIRRFTDEGGLFAVSTGRIPENMMEQIDGVVWNAPGIVLNGAAIFDPISNSYLHTLFADKDAMSSVVHFALSTFPDLDIQVYTETGIYYVSPEETVNRPFWELHKHSTFISVQRAEQEPWFKTLLFGNRQSLDIVTEFIHENNYSDCFDQVFAATDIIPGVEYLELLPKGVNKGSGLEYCRSLPCYSDRTMICIGDYNNDKEMLEHADISVCPKNSHPDILRICDVIVPSNNNSALAGLINRIPIL